MARHMIFYFTGTGNSLAVARQLKSYKHDTKILPIIQSANRKFEEETLSIGLVYPIYVNAVPKVVADFLKELDEFKGYFYAIATHGGRPGVAGLNLFEHIKHSKNNLDAYYEIEMINNTPKGLAPKLFMRLNWENEITQEHINHMILENTIKIEVIASQIKDEKKIYEISDTKIINKIKSLLMKPMWLASEKGSLKVDFVLDKQCKGCGKCSEVCSTQRIQIINNRPNWIHESCHCCYACFNFCPEQAIGVKHYTKKLGRYHHPAITCEDIVNQIGV